MKKYFTIMSLLLCIGICSAFTLFQNCELLPNGVYLVTYTSANPPKEGRLVIQNGRFTHSDNSGDSLSGKLKWLYNCTFAFERDVEQKQDTSHLNGLLQKSFGEPCVELKAISRDTLTFRMTYTGNLHITISEGKYIKVK